MRTGSNPAKDQPELPPYGRHRIIVPIFVPALSGYFEHALEILELSLDSLRRTASGRASITLIANGCVPDVLRKLQTEFAHDWVDQVVINRSNRGQVDAVASAARGCFEDLITVADGDALFLPGWLEALEEIFLRFPECGVASPFPTPNLAWKDTSATVIGAWLRGELRVEKVVPEADLDRFAASVGTPGIFRQKVRDRQLVVRRNGFTACVGSGHLVFTMRREVIAGIPPEPCLRALDGWAARRWLDEPGDRLGFWRFSTTRAYAYHMGNSPEEWMYKELEAVRHETTSPQPNAATGGLAVEGARPSHMPYRLRLLMLRALRASVERGLLRLRGSR